MCVLLGWGGMAPTYGIDSAAPSLPGSKVKICGVGIEMGALCPCLFLGKEHSKNPSEPRTSQLFHCAVAKDNLHDAL